MVSSALDSLDLMLKEVNHAKIGISTFDMGAVFLLHAFS